MECLKGFWDLCGFLDHTLRTAVEYICVEDIIIIIRCKWCLVKWYAFEDLVQIILSSPSLPELLNFFLPVPSLGLAVQKYSVGVVMAF